MGDPTTPPPSRAGRPGDPARRGLAEALESLREATRSLSSHGTAPSTEKREGTRKSPDTSREAAASPPDPEAQAFYEDLERSGHLMDVTEATDLSNLPPRTTHIRWPDGRIERVGFA